MFIKTLKILAFLLLIVCISGVIYLSIPHVFSTPSQNFKILGMESQWAMPRNSGMNICHSYSGYGNKTLTSFQGTMGTMSFGLDPAQHSNVLITVYMSNSDFESNGTTYNNPCMVNGTVMTGSNVNQLLANANAIELIPIIHKLYGNGQINTTPEYVLNDTIPAHYWLNVFTAADTSSTTNAWIDTELQGRLDFK